MMRDDLGTSHLRFERRGPIGWCTIDRPEARNALTASMYFGIRKAVDLVNRDPGLGALVITGVGDVFAPGGEMGGRHDDGNLDVGALLGMDVLPFKALRNSAAPVVSAVNGLCQGGGLMTALLSDVAVASERAVFRAPELLRGVADSWYAAVLPTHVGVARARELVLTGRRIDAAEAERIGLIARVVPHEELLESAEEIARSILDTAPIARAQWKRMVNSRYGWIDEPTFEASVRGDECVEGFRAFVEKRPPSWVPSPDRVSDPDPEA
jgi:enoyl-CoA hydratase/carnithine racemase